MGTSQQCYLQNPGSLEQKKKNGGALWQVKPYHYSPSNQLEQWYKETTADSSEFPKAQGSHQSLIFWAQPRTHRGWSSPSKDTEFKRHTSPTKRTSLSCYSYHLLPWHTRALPDRFASGYNTYQSLVALLVQAWDTTIYILQLNVSIQAGRVTTNNTKHSSLKLHSCVFTEKCLCKHSHDSNLDSMQWAACCVVRLYSFGTLVLWISLCP